MLLHVCVGSPIELVADVRRDDPECLPGHWNAQTFRSCKLSFSGLTNHRPNENKMSYPRRRLIHRMVRRVYRVA